MLGSATNQAQREGLVTDPNYVPLHCPKCRERVIELAGDINAENLLTCASCRAQFKAGDLRTIADQSIVDMAADMLRDRLKGIKGFKPKK